MHLYKAQLLVIAVILLGFTSCITPVKAANTLTISKLAPTEQNGSSILNLDTYRKASLRSLEAGDPTANEEERAFSFSSLKKLIKYVPGTKYFKSADKKVDPTFILTRGAIEGQLFAKSKTWNKFSIDEIKKGLMQAGQTEREAKNIVDLYTILQKPKPIW